MNGKSKKKGYIGLGLIAILLVITIVADVLVAKYLTMIKLYFRNTDTSVYEMSADEALAAASEFNVNLEDEGIVMLKNSEGMALPLEAGTKINLFGIASYQTLYQGSGSASSWFKQDLNVNFKQGLEDAGFEVNPGLWQFYEDNYQERSDQEGGMTDMSGADHSILEQPVSQYEEYSYEGKNVLEYSKGYSDVAVLVLGRAGGEGSDAVMEMDGYVGGDAGKHYLELQSVEQELLSYIEQNYDTVIIVLNTAMAMETGFIDDEAVDAAFWVGMPGSKGCESFGKILAGEINPSGHLTDTYAYALESAPSYYNFGDYTYSNFEGNNKYVYYQEGIYVGYRYYETAAVDGYIDNDETVTLTLNVDDMAAYDYRNEQCYVLSGGDYALRLQTDSHNVKVNGDGAEVEEITYTVDNTVVYNDANQGKRSTDVVEAINRFDDVTAGDGFFGEDAEIIRYLWLEQPGGFVD